jgi:hypothetical protein
MEHRAVYLRGISSVYIGIKHFRGALPITNKQKKTMQIVRRIVAVVLATFVLAILAIPVSAQEMDRDTLLTGAQWEAFNKSLVSAVVSDNEGVKEGALVQIAHYGDYMEFPELTVFEVMRLYRDSDDPKIKRLAVVALGNMGSRWAIEFLDMLAPYEEDETIRKTMESVVRAHR